MPLPDYCNNPRLARDALVLGPSAALNRDPTITSGVNNTSQTVHNYVFHSNPQHLNLHVWCLGEDSSKNKAFLWRWQRELLPLRGHQQGPSTSQSGPYLKNGVEKIQWISPLHLWNISQIFYVPVPWYKQAPLDHWWLQDCHCWHFGPSRAPHCT